MQTLFKNAHKIPVAVVGGRGYSGQELARLLKHHPAAEITGSFNSSNVNELKPELYKTVFLATPAEVSLELAPKFLAAGLDVIDLSGAFRLPVGDVVATYEKWYKLSHQNTEWVAKAHYGLVPWNKAQKKAGATLVANPGCYASAVLMAILPLLKAGLIDPATLVIDAKSGTTGAGKKAEESLLFSEVDGECLPYKIGAHQHLPEITQWTQLIGGVSIDPFFTTHLLSCRRGIIAGVYARLASGKTAEDVKQAYEQAYSEYPLVQYGQLQLKKVVGTANTHITYNVTDNKLHVFSSIDNLLKGAASQALENFNQLNDLPLTLGLSHLEALT